MAGGPGSLQFSMSGKQIRDFKTALQSLGKIGGHGGMPCARCAAADGALGAHYGAWPLLRMLRPAASTGAWEPHTRRSPPARRARSCPQAPSCWWRASLSGCGPRAAVAADGACCRWDGAQGCWNDAGRHAGATSARARSRAPCVACMPMHTNPLTTYVPLQVRARERLAFPTHGRLI